MNKEMLSVVVPVYNVEPYMDECINTLVKQTYENMEILLIDDGSTDSSGMKCDLWAKKDKRIKVIHKENGGLSDARNVGMDNSKGEYIGFIDSDDLVEDTFFEVLMDMICKHNVKIACCRWDIFGDIESANWYQEAPKANGIEKVISGEDFLKNMLNYKWGYTTPSVWDRVYHKSVIEGVRFPQGIRCEDIFFSTECMLKAKRIAYLDKALYHYRVRNGSITQSPEAYKQVTLDMFYLRNKQVRLLEEVELFYVADLFKMKYGNEAIYFSAITDDQEFRYILSKYKSEWNISTYSIIKAIVFGDLELITALKAAFPRLYSKSLKMKKL